MSILHAFDPDPRAIFNPEDAYPRIEGFPETVIVTFTRRVLEIAAHRFDLKVEGTIDGEEGLPVYSFEYEGKKLGVYRVTMGAAGVVALMEELRIMGAKNFVYFGTCGTLDASIPAGHIIVPSEAYRDEGTSYHYAPPEEDFIPVKTAEKTAALIEALGFRPFVSRVWTTDGLYRETRRKKEKMTSLGCTTVDMECSAIHACAEFRGLNAYQFFFAEDNLDAVEWDPRICGNIPRDILEFTLNIALGIAVRIS